MKFARILLLAFASAVVAGCITDEQSELEWLAELRAYDVENLIDPVVPKEARILTDYTLLIGDWKGVFDCELIYTKDWIINRRENRMYTFREDGTYSFSVFGETSEYTLNVKGGGRWLFEEGKLILTEFGEISRVYNPATCSASNNYHGKYRNVEKKMRVLMFDGDEIMLQFMSAKDMSDSEYAVYKQNNSRYFDGARISCGYNRDGAAVVRAFYFTGRRGLMQAVVSSQSHYKRIGQAIRLTPIATRQPQQPYASPQTVVPPPVSRSPAYGNVNCERVPGCDFAFTYSVEILDKSQNQIDIWREVQSKICEAVRKMYAISFQSSARERIVVDFPEHDLVNGRISGRAVVLAITPVSLIYDENTMRGKLAVRLNAAQFVEARDWIRKNIGMLARDKNIALLTSGQPPPDARYYSLSEKFEGDIMEIEFRTE